MTEDYAKSTGFLGDFGKFEEKRRKVWKSYLRCSNGSENTINRKIGTFYMEAIPRFFFNSPKKYFFELDKKIFWKLQEICQ